MKTIAKRKSERKRVKEGAKKEMDKNTNIVDGRKERFIVNGFSRKRREKSDKKEKNDYETDSNVHVKRELTIRFMRITTTVHTKTSRNDTFCTSTCTTHR